MIQCSSRSLPPASSRDSPSWKSDPPLHMVPVAASWDDATKPPVMQGMQGYTERLPMPDWGIMVHQCHFCHKFTVWSSGFQRDARPTAAAAVATSASHSCCCCKLKTAGSVRNHGLARQDSKGLALNGNPADLAAVHWICLESWRPKEKSSFVLLLVFGLVSVCFSN